MSGMWKTVSGFPKEQVQKNVERPVLTPSDLVNKIRSSEGHGNIK